MRRKWLLQTDGTLLKQAEAGGLVAQSLIGGGTAHPRSSLVAIATFPDSRSLSTSQTQFLRFLRLGKNTKSNFRSISSPSSKLVQVEPLILTHNLRAAFLATLKPVIPPPK